MCLSHGKPWIWSPAPKIRKEGQERRLTSLQLLLLFQRTQIQFPAPTQGNSQLQEIPCLQEHLKSCLHITPIYIIKMIKYILNYQKTQSQHTKWEGYRVRHLSPTPTHNVPPAPRAAARGWYYLPRGSQDMLSHKSSHWILGYTGCKWLLSPFTDRASKCSVACPEFDLWKCWSQHWKPGGLKLLNYVPPYPWMTESWVLKTRMCCKQSCYKDRFADGQETGEISSFPNVCIPEGATQALPWAAYSDTPSVSLGRFTVTPSSISLGRLTVTSLLCLSWGWLTVTPPRLSWAGLQWHPLCLAG